MRVGVIARDDQGGLASQTYEVWRNLRPDRVLVVDMGVHTRGERGDHQRYRSDWSELHIAIFRHFGIEVDQFFAGLDVVYCADDETEALTMEGWKRHDDLRVGDLVLTLREDHLSEWQRVEAVNVFPEATRRMLSIESRGHSSLTTEDHRWLVAHDLTGPKSHHCYRDRRVRTSKELRGADRIPRSAPSVDLPTEPKSSDDWVELVAWFYTEGHQRAGSDAVGITQSERANPGNCARIRSALVGVFGSSVDRFPRVGRRRPVSPMWRESVNERGIVTFHLNVVAGAMLAWDAPRKVVRRAFIHSLTKAQLELFLDVSMLADNNGPRAFAQKDPARCDAFELASILLGRAVSRRSTPMGDETCVGLYKTNLVYLDMARREWIDHRGVVWCPTTRNGSWFARRRGTMYFTGNSAETMYDERLWAIAKNAGVKIALHSNPELFAPDHHQADGLWVPTDWELGRMPDQTRVVPMPCVVPDDWSQKRRLDTMFFTAGAAMMDRNGAESVRGALAMVEHPCRLLVRVGAHQELLDSEQVGPVTVEYLPAVESYEDVIPPETDLLLMPRRYGGLCLPVQEAAARGIPAIMSDLAPQNRWPGVFLTRATLRTRTQMKGGLFEIQDVSPGDLADMINHVGANKDLLALASGRARAWAESLSWEKQLPVWRDELGKVIG